MANAPDNLEISLEKNAGRKKFRRLAIGVFLVVIIAHLIVGVGSAVLIVARYFSKPQAQFTVVQKVEIKAEERKHRLNMEKVESMRAKPVFNNRIQSLKPTALVLPELPKVPVDTEIPLANTVVADVAVGNAGQTGIGSGSGIGNGFFGAAGLADSGLLEGYIYDLKQTNEGKRTEMTPEKYNSELRRFIAEGWKDSSLAGYFRGKDPLFTRQIYIPTINADSAPKAFKVADRVRPKMWAVLYRGTISPTVGGRFRFVGYGDDILVVRFNKKIVLDGSNLPPTGWRSRVSARPNNHYLVLGDWLTIGKGEKDKI